ncbi:hypothetical protein LPH50_02385 [Xylella taiwanensis]|uniref:Transposase n=2 Tax=Xylella taiwanensis TaxID=1444770 RepID=A0ABS8TTI4_9GAMM|nr:hypothetical protein [Xylella taiwanensis]MCD8459498.1 hypothetical protein [Xylella taiwanensis]MCD8461633.1 hypothetical protein [Xylella taiwanensis]MCD8462339.1 hypothetical protein [Xylella taiwanensis]MCD8466123.1 hypothetical protein [Xylella taiwanensis]MCD8469107.1 hypothetical protein [Xylella taiwanensis]
MANIVQKFTPQRFHHTPKKVLKTIDLDEDTTERCQTETAAVVAVCIKKDDGTSQ